MDQDRSTMGEQGGASGAPVYANDGASAQNGSDGPVWSGGTRNAQGHWQKHGSEFPQFNSEQDYVDGAHAFVSHPPAGTQIKHRGNGDTLYFDPGSGTFAVQAPNGAPRTMFKPGDGEAYWERQR
jgi:filamentous hemagglutinin